MDPISSFLQSGTSSSPSSFSSSPSQNHNNNLHANHLGNFTTMNQSTIGTNTSRKVLVSVLLNLHSRLTITHIKKGNITYDDLLQCLHFIVTNGLVPDLTGTEDIGFYAGILYEVCFQPAMLPKGPGFTLRKDLIGNEANFLKAVVDVLVNHNGGKENLIIEDLKFEINILMKKMNLPVLFEVASLNPANMNPSNRYWIPPNTSSNYSVEPPNRHLLQPANVTKQDFGVPSFQITPPPVVSTATTNAGYLHPQQQQQQQQLQPQAHGYHSFGANIVRKGPNPRPNYQSTVKNSPYEEFNTNSTVGQQSLTKSVEKSESIVRLLAHLRKSGMDILFPQIIHDKILMCIYVAMACTSTLTHRELIDMVMSIKDSHAVSQIDTTSKTKIRGVLALLKHGQLFLTKGEEGEAVQLYLAEDIGSFKELREKHDIFLGNWIAEHHLYIPATLKGELLWQLDPETKAMRVEELKGLEKTVEHYYLHVYQPSSNLSEANSNGDVTSETGIFPPSTSSPRYVPTFPTNTATSTANASKWYGAENKTAFDSAATVFPRSEAPRPMTNSTGNLNYSLFAQGGIANPSNHQHPPSPNPIPSSANTQKTGLLFVDDHSLERSHPSSILPPSSFFSNQTTNKDTPFMSSWATEQSRSDFVPSEEASSFQTADIDSLIDHHDDHIN